MFNKGSQVMIIGSDVSGEFFPSCLGRIGIIKRPNTLILPQGSLTISGVEVEYLGYSNDIHRSVFPMHSLIEVEKLRFAVAPSNTSFHSIEEISKDLLNNNINFNPEDSMIFACCGTLPIITKKSFRVGGLL